MLVIYHFYTSFDDCAEESALQKSHEIHKEHEHECRHQRCNYSEFNAIAILGLNGQIQEMFQALCPLPGDNSLQKDNRSARRWPIYHPEPRTSRLN